jgi:hypothetical protein
VRRLQNDFIPAVGEHIALTRGLLSAWWDSVVRSANPRYAGGSTQGYYVLAADGSGIVSDNYIPRIPEFLERGLALARQSSGGSSPFPVQLARAAAPQEPPAGASVLRLFTRIRPLPAGANPMNAMLGRDYMWVPAEEVREMAAAAERGSEAFPLPRTLAARLVLFHLVDNVRGQVWIWQPNSIRQADLTGQAVRQSGTVRTLAIRGRFAKQDSHPPQWMNRGEEGTIEGELDIDTRTARIVRCRLLAEGQAWSDATYNPVAAPPQGRYPIATAIVEATDDLARRVPPEQAAAGNYYLRPPLPL